MRRAWTGSASYPDLKSDGWNPAVHVSELTPLGSGTTSTAAAALGTPEPTTRPAQPYTGPLPSKQRQASGPAMASMLPAMPPMIATPTWRPRGPAQTIHTSHKPEPGAGELDSPKKGSPPPPWRHPALLGVHSGHSGRSRHLCLSSTLLAALMVCWVGYSAVHSSQQAAPPSAAPALSRQLYTEVEKRSGQSVGVEAAGTAYVEFTAPGLFIPLREALDLSTPLRPSEQALLDLLPTPQEMSAAPTTPPRPTLEQYLEQQALKEAEKARKQASLATAAGVTQGVMHWQGLARGAQPGTAAGRAGGGAGAVQQAAAGAGVSVDGDDDDDLDVEERAPPAGTGAVGATVVGATAAGATSAGPTAAGAAPQGGAGQQVGGGREGVHAAEEAVLVRKLLDTPQDQAPSSEDHSVRLLVGVTSACCTEKAYRRRQALRDTWAGLAQGQVEGAAAADIKFVLAQPESPAALEAWLPLLEEEVRLYNDTVVLRGPDTYRTLPNKTVRLMRYAAAHPAAYTHVLKTDDDCYVRLPRLLKALEAPPPPPEGAGAGAAGTAAVTATAGREGAGLGPVPGSSGGQVQAALKRWTMPKMVHSDGLSTYSLRELTRKLGRKRWVDDMEGNAFTLGQMVNASRTGVHPWAGAAGRGGGNGYGTVGSVAAAMVRQHAAAAAAGRVRMAGVYMGCVENKNGFWPIRDPKSKWYIPPEALPNSAVPFGVKYLAGWGYLLSRDLVEHAVKKVNLWQAHPEKAPAWFKPLDWEDVLMGFLMMDKVQEPEDHEGFRAAWRACPNSTAVVHMDVDAPVLMPGLHAQQVSGLWDVKPVQCSSGAFLPGDYAGWKRWRDSLSDVERL